MSKNFSLLKSAKFIVLIVFTILSVLSVFLMGLVGTNYNISDYLDPSTDTKISLGIMEEEFGLISNVQVMVDDVTADDAEAIKEKIKSIDNVTFVNFDSQNTDYFKKNNDNSDKGTALFVVLVDGDEYSTTANNALADIVELMDREYGEQVNYGGTVMEKQLLREAIQSEIVLILVISLCLVAVLMLITAASWIEPLILLAASGIAVLLNMGSNFIFGEISYITKAVAAILQLALSIDYSIVLLHSYRALKKTESDNDKAMLMAIKNVIKPVSASALTTIAGLLALLFMSFTIGFDIGIVLMKSIVISAICSLTLLPAMLLIFDKLMQITPKKPLVIKGKIFADMSFKAGKFIVPVAALAIIVCCVLSGQNSYNFVDSCNKNENITNKFGDSGTLIVLYEKSKNDAEKEQILAEFLSNYKTESGNGVIKNVVSYGSTVEQIFDVDKAVNDLGIPEDNAKLLFTIYYFTQDDTLIKLDIREFIDLALDLIENDEDAKEFASAETVEALEKLLDLDLMLRGSFNNATELNNKIEEMLDMASIDLDKVISDSGFGDLIGKIKPETMSEKQFFANYIYCLRFYDDIANKSISFDEVISLITDFSDLIPGDLTSQLDELMLRKEQFEGLKDKVNRKEFEEYLIEMQESFQDDENLSGDITIPDIAYTAIWKGDLHKRISIIDVLKQIKEDYPEHFPEVLVPIVDNFDKIDTALHSSYEYDELISSIEELTTLIGRPTDVPIDDSLVKQLYLMHFAAQDNTEIPEGEMNTIQLLEFLSETLDDLLNNEFINGKIDADKSEELTSRLESLVTDAKALINFLDDESKYDYKEITDNIKDFINNIGSMPVDVSLSDTAIMGLYLKYAIKNNVYDLEPITATDLLEFVLDAKENNPLLEGKINEEMSKTLEESKANIASAEKLLKSENYSRILLTVTLAPEGKESSSFVEALSTKVHEVFGDKAYVAGEIATTHDLINAFDDDNNLISIFTVVSIFIIILVVFKSLSLPVILVAVIQGAVWISMSFTLISGGSMFFMSYIMSMCILMGATIDYGILLSTNYVNYRSDMDKREALAAAIDSAMPTIFNSGIILMICGFIVGLVASQTSISSVGFLLCRGTLVSVIMITMVLPSLLYLLDKVVLKLTITKKNK